MKSVMAWHSLNSTSQGSTTGLRGFLLCLNRYCYKNHPDSNVCTQWSCFGFTSKASLKSHSQILTAVFPSPLCSLFPSPVRHVPPIPGFCQNLLDTVHLALLCTSQLAGRGTSKRATLMLRA